MTTGIPETTRKRFTKKVVARIWRKALMPCYYNCPHEYVVRERDLFYRGRELGLLRARLSIPEENDSDARRATEVAASPRCSVVRRTVCLLAD